MDEGRRGADRVPFARRLWQTGAIVALTTVPAALAAQPAALHVSLGERSVALQVSHHRAYPAVSASELAAGLGVEGQLEPPYVRVALAGGDLVFEDGSPFFRYRDRLYQLANPAYRWGGGFWLPAELVTRWWPRALGSGTTGAMVAGPPLRPARLDPDRPWRVIIDPGHGGKDPGTSGRRSREKEVVLAIARALHGRLADMKGFQPLLTRDTDEFVPLEERSKFAVEQAGDLFVSVHANWAAAARASGFETIFLGLARSDEARDVAMRENSALSLEDDPQPPGRDIQFILTGLDRDEHLLESRRFGGYVQNALRDSRGGPGDRGVKQGPWWVLLGALARMPSVIVEVGFLSNENEERYLLSADGQSEVARSIATAISRYRHDLIASYDAEAEQGTTP